MNKRLSESTMDRKKSKISKNEPKLDSTKLDQIFKELDQLRKDIKEQNEMIKEQNEKIEEQDVKISTLQERMDGIIEAFEPSTLFCLMETAVHNCIRPYIERKKNSFVNEASYDEWQKRASYSFARLASQLLTGLLEDSTECKELTLYDKKRVLGPISVFEKTRLAVLILKGLASFLDTLYEEVKDWLPDRNPLMHNGKFLSALYGLESCDSRPTDNPKWSKQKVIDSIESMDKCREDFRDCRYTKSIDIGFALLETRIKDGEGLAFYNVTDYKNRFANALEAVTNFECIYS